MKKEKFLNLFRIIHLGTFLKYLGRNKVYTLINVFGLAVSLAFVILIALYVKRELSTDTFHPHADRIYVLGNDRNLDYACRIAYRLPERYPEIEKVCPVIPWYVKQTVLSGEKKFEVRLTFADTTFFDFFGFKLHGALPQQALSDPNAAILSRRFARKVFGDKDPTGEKLYLNDSLTLTVNGVTDNIANSILPYGDIVLQIANIRFFNSVMYDDNFSNAGQAYIFLMEKKGADLRAKTGDMATLFKEIFWIFRRGINKDVTLTPLKKAYFSNIKGLMLLHGDKQFVTILIAVGLAILIFALINYVNLTVAQAGFRAREMAMRRLLGATRRELFIRLVAESTLLCLFAFLIAAAIATALAPSTAALLEIKHARVASLSAGLSLSTLLTPGGIGLALGIILALGVISGWMPATIISNVKPLDITKGTLTRKNKMVFSKYFIMLQYAITVILLVSALTITLQTQHLIHAPLGYNTPNILTIPSMPFDSLDEINVFADEARRLASVKRVGYTRGTPLNGGNNNSVSNNGKNIALQILEGDTTAFAMLGFKLLRENQTGRDDAYYFSRQAMKETELDDEATEFRLSESNYTIPVAGIMEDVRLSNITRALGPVLFRFMKASDYPWDVLVEVQGDPHAAYRQVKQLYERITGLEFDGAFIDDRIAESFAVQRRTSQIIRIFTGIAILISLLGLLAMSLYFIRQRTKEIAIRKVHGAESREIMIRLVRTFLTYAGIAFVIAAPVARYIMRRWLEDYAYRIRLSPWIFVAVGAFCFLTALLTVLWQSRIAANANPVKALKSE